MDRAGSCAYCMMLVDGRRRNAGQVTTFAPILDVRLLPSAVKSGHLTQVLGFAPILDVRLSPSAVKSEYLFHQVVCTSHPCSRGGAPGASNGRRWVSVPLKREAAGVTSGRRCPFVRVGDWVHCLRTTCSFPPAQRTDGANGRGRRLARRLFASALDPAAPAAPVDRR